MKRTAAVILIMVVSLAIFLSWSPSVKPVLAQNVGYSISSVDHEIQIMNSGNVVIKDTIQVTGQLQGDFLIGFPYKYGSSVLKAEAYDANEVLNVSLGVPLGSRNGYYGASVSFPPDGAPQVFTVLFILSNSLVTPTSLGYSVDFPAYPSLVTDVSFCNVTLIIPSLSTNMSILKSDGEVDGVTNFVKNNLSAYTYSPATFNFNLVTGYIQLSELQTLNRQITLSPTGMVTCSDSYSFVNDQAAAMGDFIFNLPLNASNIVAESQLGSNLTVSVTDDDSGRPMANVTLLTPINQGQTTDVTLDYTLLRVAPQKTTLFNLNLDLFSDLQYYVDHASITINPPEGARFTAPALNSAGASYTLTRDIFQQTLTIYLAGVSFVDSLTPPRTFSRSHTTSVHCGYLSGLQSGHGL